MKLPGPAGTTQKGGDSGSAGRQMDTDQTRLSQSRKPAASGGGPVCQEHLSWDSPGPASPALLPPGCSWGRGAPGSGLCPQGAPGRRGLQAQGCVPGVLLGEVGSRLRAMPGWEMGGSSHLRLLKCGSSTLRYDVRVKYTGF